VRKGCLSIALLAAAAIAAPNPRVLAPSGTFHLQDALPAGYDGSSTTIHQFQAAAGGLYFLVSPGFNFASGGHLIKTDFSGKRLLSIPIAPGQHRVFAADENGRVYVAMLDRGENRRIAVYGPQGGEERSVPFRARVSALCVENGTPVLLSREGFLSVAGDAVRPTIGVGRGRRVQMQRLPDGKYVVVKGVEAEIAIVDPDKGVENSFTPDAPEIAEARKRYGKGEQGVILNGLAVGPNGEIFVVVTGHRLGEGAPVLVLGPDGRVQDRLRLMLPELPVAAGDAAVTAQRMMPSFIGADGPRIFLADSSGFVAWYAW